MKVIYTGETPPFEDGLPEGMVSIGFNAENKPVFEIPDGSLPDGAREAREADLSGLPGTASAFRKMAIQGGIVGALSKPGEPADMQRVAMSLIGKTSNALSAVLDIHAQVYARLAAAQSLADVRAAIEPAIPLMTRVAAMRESGELISVQYTQGMDDVDAVIEGLVAMTVCAKVVAEHQPPAAA